MRYKVMLILFMLILFIFGAGITYSVFYSGAALSSNNQDIAKFIFNTESLDQLQLPLIDLNPGDSKEYSFSVSNNYQGNISDVSVEYKMTIKTYHLVPLIIELYKGDEGAAELILTCDETYTRNSQNELICNTPIQEMGHSVGELDNYKLKVNFPSKYNDAMYSDLVDYINIGIESWQIVKE